MRCENEDQPIPQWKVEYDREQALKIVAFFGEAVKVARDTFDLPHPRNKALSDRENDIGKALRLLRIFTVDDAQQLIGEYLKPPPGGYVLPESYEWPSFPDFTWHLTETGIASLAWCDSGIVEVLRRLGEGWCYAAELRKEQEAPPDEPRPLDDLFVYETVRDIMARGRARRRRVRQVLGLHEETTPRSVRRERGSVGRDRRVPRRRKEVRGS